MRHFSRLHARIATTTMLVTAGISVAFYFADLLDGQSSHLSARGVLSDLLGTTLVALVIGWIVGIVASRPFVRRLGKLGAAAQEWAQGHLDQRVNDSKQDELGVLSRRLDAMADELSASFALREAIAVAQERENLALELHDGIKQQMFALALHLSSARAYQRAAMNSPAALGEALDSAHAVAGQVQHDLLRLVRTWSEPRFTESPTFTDLTNASPDETEKVARPVSLTARLQEMAQTWSCHERAPEITVKVAADVPLLPSHIAYELKAIAHEALANAVRHAEAASVSITLQRRDDPPSHWLRLSIVDDGNGFVPEQARGGLGLMAMKMRATRLPGGDLHLESTAESGSSVMVECHLKEEQVVA